MSKATGSPHWLIRAAAALFAPIYVLSTGIQTNAGIPDAAIVKVIGGSRDEIRIRPTERSTETKPVTGNPGWNHLGRDRGTLYIPGDDTSRVSLTFVEGSIRWEYGGHEVQTIPSNKRTEFSYPCQWETNSGLTMGWRRSFSNNPENRGCNDGVKVGRARDKNAQLPNHRNLNLIQAAKNLLKAQVDEEVVVVPEQGETLIQTFDTGSGIDVVVAQGDVKVKSAKHPEGQPVKAGERYSYPQDTITSVDLKALAQSPSMQDFLNPANWSPPEIPQRVADEVAEQMNQHRAALGLPPQSIVSRPGNNNNPSQPPTASNPGTSASLPVVSGSGRITRSDYPAVAPVGTSVSQVTGGYNPYTRKITLEIEGRQAEISLNSPLSDGTPIPFTVTRIIPRFIDGSGQTIGSQFAHLVKEALVKEGIQANGTLIKKGNQIQGKFTTQGRWRLMAQGPGKPGSVDGEFFLTLQPGTSSNFPQLRSYTAPEWQEYP